MTSVLAKLHLQKSKLSQSWTWRASLDAFIVIWPARRERQICIREAALAALPIGDGIDPFVFDRHHCVYTLIGRNEERHTVCQSCFLYSRPGDLRTRESFEYQLQS